MRSVMAVTLNRRAFDHAKDLIDENRFVERDAWSEHRPSAQDENEFLRLHGFAEYGKWYLRINDQHPEETKGHNEFPYGDFEKVHRCGVLAAESRAGQYKHLEPVREVNESLESLMIQERRPESLGGLPMWTNANRARYDRPRLRYPSDLTDA